MKKRTLIVFGILFLFYSCIDSKNEIGKGAKKYEPSELVGSLEDTWQLDGKGGITWDINGESHADHIEFSGLKVSGIITYGIDNRGQLVLSKKVVWPMLRLIPNDTHASLIHEFDDRITPAIFVDGVRISTEEPVKIRFDGLLTISSLAKNIEINRNLFPSTNEPAIIEIIRVKNISEQNIDIQIGKLAYQTVTPENKGVNGSYTIVASNEKEVKQSLKQGEEVFTSVVYKAFKKDEQIVVDVRKEKDKRKNFIESIKNTLVLETPNEIIDQMFSFAKLRASESIFATKGGLMHGPGGGRYYAAIWANDQAEYANPFFPFLGYKIGNESAINSFRHFGRFVNPEYYPIPSSIIAEGDDIWNGAGDRGDAAMIAYGASRFALAYGDKDTAESLLPLIEWCLEYCEQKMLPEGIIASDCDELENRFPAGKANLSTNILAYGAYLSSADLLGALELKTGKDEKYRQKAEALRQSCDRYFGGIIQNFQTYKYFEGNEKLRSWICLPLVMGINDRKEETLDALFSPFLWSKDGIYTEAGDSTFWDRSTLYAFRGIFFAGETDIAMEYFKYYSQKRLLGEHVPYAVEAYPEGNQRHLSAESALYCRVITEGLFGIVPTGLRSFNLSPRLPSGWDYMKLKKIKAFGNDFDISVFRLKNDFKVQIIKEERVLVEKIWDGQQPISISL